MVRFICLIPLPKNTKSAASKAVIRNRAPYRAVGVTQLA